MIRYYVKDGISKLGPFSLSSLASMRDAKQIDPNDNVSIDGKTWIQARFIPGLFDGFSELQKVLNEPVINAATPPSIPAFGLFIKLLVGATILALLFGLFLGWVSFSPDHKSIANLKDNFANLEGKHTSLEENLRNKYIPKEFHQVEVAKISDEGNKKNEDLQAELKKSKNMFSSSMDDVEAKLKKAVMEVKNYSGKLDEIEMLILPFKELIASLPDNPNLNEMLVRLQKVPLAERGLVIDDCLKVLASLNLTDAQRLRTEYKFLKSKNTDSIPEIILNWGICVSNLHLLATEHKNTEASKGLMNEIKTGIDLVGLFMLRQLSDPNKIELMNDKIKNSKSNEKIKEKATNSLSDAQKNAKDFETALGIEASKLIPKNETKTTMVSLLKKIQDSQNNLFEKTKNEDPVQIERYSIELENLSELVMELAFQYSAKVNPMDVKNDLSKYKIFIHYAKQMETKDLREEFVKKVNESIGGTDRRKPEDLRRYLEKVAFNMQIAELAGFITR